LAGQGKKDQAIAEYERLTSPDPGVRRQELIHPFSRFRLAKLYEETGQKAKALAQYEKLAEIWSKADAGLPYVDEARAALARLKGR
jgi:tetratricopeptide (TPR) repeat protein